MDILDFISNHPLFVFVAGLASIIGLIYTVIIDHSRKKKRILDYNFKTTVLVTDQLAEVEGLDIKYQEEPIDQLSVTCLELSNVGFNIIEEEDIYPEDPLKVVLNQDEVDILCSKAVTKPNDTIGGTAVCNDKGVDIKFKALEVKESLVVNIYHTGNEDTVFDMKGKIKEGELRNKESKKVISLIKPAAVVISYFVVLFLLSFLFVGKHVIQAFASWSMEVLIVIIAGLILRKITA